METDGMQDLIREGLQASYCGTHENFSHVDESGRSIGKEEIVYLGSDERDQAHKYIINSLSMVDEFKEEHLNVLKQEKPRMSSYNREKLHSETFVKWFKDRVNATEQSNEDLRHLAIGPSKWMNPRNLFNVDPEVNVTEGSEDANYVHQHNARDSGNDDASWVRVDVEGIHKIPQVP
ncbi:OLC1v1015349C1 [Oldenlandia corymbosa var. corymbosa]|uniref:OLC1v1015349C1 n=1 Tax=Oldenlandia corymbosa var. corymbosa TaxID=529605 RepID=A0AAV1E313_OLDCO|nr:OLC1v1015349C1 [Oldenlandia corymbosa var. corymbosa]